MSLQGKKLLTFILAGGKGSRLYPLTRDRSKPAVYFAARFRIIDFVLSSCINSGLRQVYILTQHKSLSLEGHLRNAWNLLAHELGEFIATVPAQQRISEQWYSGTADAIFQNLHLIEDHRPEHVLILSGDHIYNLDFNEMYQQHVSSGADLTASVLTIKKDQASEFGVLTMDEQLRIDSFIEKPQSASQIKGDGDECYINMGIYLFKTEALVRELAKDARLSSSHDFGRNIIPNMLGSCHVSGFIFENSRFGYYWRDVGTIRSYYEANMDFLGQLGEKIVCTSDWRIGSIGTYYPPTYYGGEKGVLLQNSTVGIGSHLYDCTIKNSLIGRNVSIEAGSVIEDSILMPNAKVGKNCIVRRAIFDDGATVPDNIQIGIDSHEDARHFFMSDGIAVLPKRFRY
ncbi:MAG: glucose-1-phosphate adenylyltransferase [SAR324 cluster bacterium]|uniref:Glucose-1-phosphate adenylyltransferase n=1 Tax=SAR324 cluster bacterium TaxID=2024889 RepID=A0A2A4T2F1_9DELT|nr:MAG: glucose-1-phosphate adenylyltransferase [SAR324 cluster bacterium]